MEDSEQNVSTALNYYTPLDAEFLLEIIYPKGKSTKMYKIIWKKCSKKMFTVEFSISISWKWLKHPIIEIWLKHDGICTH